MNKMQAAELLGFTVKTLEKYMGEKRISFSRVKGKHGMEVDFNLEDIEKFKLDREEERKNSVVVSPVAVKEDLQSNPTTSLLSGVTEADSRMLITQSERFINIFERIENKLDKQVSIGEKLTLSLSEAAQLAGLSPNYLKKAIKEGGLKAAKRGKGWNVKREDLEVWVKGL